jgi:hypothetical protein
MTSETIAKWDHKIKASNEYFDRWERKFKCKKLEKYFEGFQSYENDDSYEPYVLNLFSATFAIKEPALLFKKPVFYVDPRPSSTNSLSSSAYEWASNATDLLNTIAAYPDTNLGHSLEMAVIDAGSYFGVVEVQFKTDWETNPAKGLEVTEQDPETGEEVSTGEVESDKIVTKEWIEVKRIPAHRFRVGGNDCSELKKANWCGYYEFMRADEVKKFKNSKKVTFSGNRTDEFYQGYNEDEEQMELAGDLVKVWKIWDLVEKKSFIMTHSERVVLYEEPFEDLPLFPLRFKKRRKGWYPVPFAFDWKSPQDEINETREQVRSARRRARRLWTMREGAMAPDEMDKIVSGPDGTIAIANSDAPLKPVEYPPLDSSVGLTLQLSKDDFNIVSGTSAEQRGQSDRTTATQASIIDQRATIRDNRDRETVAQWICEIGMEILKQFRNFSTLPFMTKVAHDVGGFFQDVPDIQAEWKAIQAEDLGDIEYQVDITVESLSPVANDQEKKKFMEYLAVISQYPIIATHPDLIMEAAFKLGYKNMKVVRAFQQAAMLQMVGQISQNENSGGITPNPSDNVGQQTVQQMQPPTQTQIQNQLDATGVPQ